MRFAATLLLLLVTTWLAACGGGGSPYEQFIRGLKDASDDTSSATNTLSVTVDGGPAELTNAGTPALNTLYASVKICTPGSSSDCQTIDHVRVDTASAGLRVLATVLTNDANVVAVDETASGLPLRECMRFADGVAWGSVVLADVTIGERTLSSLRLQLIGDADAGAPPADCAGTNVGTVSGLRANGVLGLGPFLRDCGSDCVAGRITGGHYYSCGGGACTVQPVGALQQLPNPVSVMSADSNGIMVQLPAVASAGAATASGTLFFGVGTQDNNALGDARLHTLNSFGSLSTTFSGVTLGASIVDSAATGYFQDVAALAPCARDANLDCPSDPVERQATLTGLDGAASQVSFTVDDAQAILDGGFAAASGFGGRNAGRSIGSGGAFTWGLPFFYGRSVYVLIENGAAANTIGPAIGF